MSRSRTPRTIPSPARSAVRAEGEALIRHLLDVMEALLGTVEQETALVRAGKLAEAAKLEATKSELSQPVRRRHRADQSEPGLSRPCDTPALAAELRQRHDLFRACCR